MIKSPLKWMGGKSHIARKIIKLIPPHKTYIELFAGALHVLCAKPPSPLEVVNDINGNLINLWLCIRDRLAKLKAYLDQLPISESLFYQFGIQLGYSKAVLPENHLNTLIPCAQNAKPLPSLDSESPKNPISYPGNNGIPHRSRGSTNGIPLTATNGIPDTDPNLDPEKAAKYYYLIRCAFNGIVRPGLSFAAGPHKRITFRRDDWNTIRSRIQDVIVLNQDYTRIIQQYDTPESFFYLDPPYFCTTTDNSYYEHNFTTDQHQTLHNILKSLKGRFLLSLDDLPETRSLYSDFHIKEISVRYSTTPELLIMNYSPPETPFYLPGTEGIPPRAQEGIPSGAQQGATGNTPQISRYAHSGPAHYTSPNCPFCQSRNVQKSYIRQTIIRSKKHRTYRTRGNFECMNCGKPFQGVPD